MTIQFKHIFRTAVICGALGLTACDKFLEERPSKTSALEVKTASQLESLLNAHNSFITETNRSAAISTDDYGILAEMYAVTPTPFNMAVVQFATWDWQYLPDDNRELFWTNEYKKIFTANMVLSLLETVSGTAEQKASLAADAHLIRAYSYFQLVNTYALPYNDATKNEPGVPIKLSTSFDEPMARAPIGKVYEQIESDLAEALKTNVALVQNGRPRHWRASKTGVKAFAARYHLARGNYAEALKFAQGALDEYSTMMDYNTDMRYGRTQTLTVNAGTPDAKTVTLQYPFTHDNQSDQTDLMGWKETLYLRVLGIDSWWFIPSKALLDLYDKDHDLRYRYHIVEGYSYDRGMIKPAYDYPGYICFYKDRMLNGPTVAEMLLIKAECLARTGKPGDAMAAVNQLRAKRMEPGAWVNLSATSDDDAIAKVLQERRREMPFAQRWFDIRRYNNNNYPNDDVSLTREFYPYNSAVVQKDQPKIMYSLPKGSRRFAAPLPRTEIIASNGAIIQNTY